MSDCQGLGDCDDARMQRIYEYLDGCPECLEEYDLECVIRKVVKRSCTEAAPENLKSAILDRIHSIRPVEA